MPKSIKTRKPAQPKPPPEAPAPKLYDSEVERFAAESVAVVYLGPDDGTHCQGRSLRHLDVVRVWPHEGRAMLGSPIFREATAEEAAAHQAACCPACLTGAGTCAAKKDEAQS